MCPAPRQPESAGKLEEGPPNFGPALKLRVLGPYRILRSIGSGGMSEVYLAYDARRRQQIAIKVLADHLVNNHTLVNRFYQEGRLGKGLSHPNLVKGFGFGRDKGSGNYYIVMELIDGPTVQERLELEGRLSVVAAARIIIDIARALEFLHHKNYVHRDIKPGNILLAPDGSAKLADLGVAKHLDNASGLTTLDQGVGTPYYMPWEQGLNACLVDARSDIFALGATFYHLVTGHVPFPGDDEAVIARQKMKGKYLPVLSHDSHLPPVIELILERMLARDPRKRFASASEVVEILTASGLADGQSVRTIEIPLPAPQPLAPTRADLKSQAEVDTPLEDGSDQVWLVKFQSEDGASKKLRARTQDVVNYYREGVLPDESLAAREPSRVFRRIKAYPEFRNLRRMPRTTHVDSQRPSSLSSGRPRGPATHFRSTRCALGRGLLLASMMMVLIGSSATLIFRLMTMH